MKNRHTLGRTGAAGHRWIRKHGQDASAAERRCGATLLVTLGVLTVISVMVVTSLLTMRHHRLSSKLYRDKTVARQALDEALVNAMRYADWAMIASNHSYSATSAAPSEKDRRRRTYPVGMWFKQNYQPNPPFEISDKVAYQAQDILLSPVVVKDASDPTNSLTVNLLTEEVCRLLPAAITNQLTENGKLRSGWIDLGTGSRVSFAVVNCSGFIDAHTFDFEEGLIHPATQTYARAYYCQQDLANNRDLQAEEIEDKTVLSFDPGPDTVPFVAGTAQIHPLLGYRDFSATNKFCINALTNFFDPSSDPEYARVRVTVAFEEQWLKKLSNHVNAAQSGGDVALGDAAKVAWNIVAYMTPSRIPMISYPGVALASRADYGIEAVPLINEVSVFNCIDESGNFENMFQERMTEMKSELQLRFEQEVQTLYPDGSVTLAPIAISNVYAAAAELWYPFVPRPIFDAERPDEIRLYLGVYTNQAQIMTTTNSQWSAGDLADRYGLDDPVVAELEANIWNDLYESDPETVTNSLFWKLVETNALVVAVIQDPDELNDGNLVDFSTGLATGYIGVYTDPVTGLVPTNNPYSDLLREYAPASPDLTPEEQALYYASPSNYIPVLVTVLTTPVDEVRDYDGGFFSDSRRSLMQQYLSAEKIQVGPFSTMWTPENPLRNEDFNRHGFCAFTNTLDLVCFPVLEKKAEENIAHVNFLPLGGTRNLWVRPLVAVRDPESERLPDNSVNEGFEAVDEALLVEDSTTRETTVLTWPPSDSSPQREYCLSATDLRDNAWAAQWHAAPNSFGKANRRNKTGEGTETGADEESEASGATDEIPGVAELPFIHFDSPLQSIGELGYITADLDSKRHNKQNNLHPIGKVRDTVDFSTRTGAALLDRLTLSPTNRPMRGLVQANTPYASVIRTLANWIPMGWTNQLDQANHLFELTDTRLAAMTECWTNTLFKAYDPSWDKERSGLPGWRCFAEMLPDLSTNVLLHAEPVYEGLESDDFYRHDYVEDIMRGFLDHISFRQNIFVVIVAAQALSPASSAEAPVILSDQRAAVTVLRDAFTGRWMIYNWVWLAE